jgi:CRP-like cAMP-binding protein
MPPANHNAIKNRLLTALPQGDLDQFYSNLHPVALSQRQILHAAGAPIEDVYFVEEGLGSVLTSMANGTMIEVGMTGVEGVIGISALLGAEASAQIALVQIPGTAHRMSASRCKSIFDRTAAFRKIALRFAEAMLNLSAQTAACNRLHSVEQRCARWLLMARDRIGSDIMPMTHEFLASMLGVRWAGVTTTAGDLQRSGLIRYHHGQLTIIDRDGLEASACECYLIDHDQLDRLL